MLCVLCRTMFLTICTYSTLVLFIKVNLSVRPTSLVNGNGDADIANVLYLAVQKKST